MTSISANFSSMNMMAQQIMNRSMTTGGMGKTEKGGDNQKLHDLLKELMELLTKMNAEESGGKSSDKGKGVGGGGEGKGAGKSSGESKTSIDDMILALIDLLKKRMDQGDSPGQSQGKNINVSIG